MKFRTGVVPGVLALIAASGMAVMPALAENVPAGETAAGEAEWQRNLEARLDLDAQTIAADAMTAAARIDLSARLDRENANDYRVLALANER